MAVESDLWVVSPEGVADGVGVKSGGIWGKEDTRVFVLGNWKDPADGT